MWEKHLGARAGEVRTGGVWQWPAAGQCMSIDLAGVSDGQFRLPYLIEDSRLEQRAAMQLQLARRYPDAVWARTFRPVPVSEGAPDNGAKYEAIWEDRDLVRGQLWIPTKGDGPVLRLQLRTRRAPAPRGAAADTVERELSGLARTWSKTHE